MENVNKALEIDPNYADSYNLRGVIKMELNDFQTALYDLKKALEINPKHKLAPENIILVQEEINYQNNLKEKTIAIEKNDENEEAYFQRARFYDEKEEFDKAIVDYSKAIFLNPKNAKAYFSRGYNKYLQLDYRGAINDFSSVIELMPEDTDAYYYRGFVRSEIDNYDEALKDFDKVIELDNKYSEVYNSRGILKSKIEDHNGAIDDFSNAIKIKSDDINALYNRGYERFKIKDYAGSISDYSKVIELDPDFKDAKNELKLAKQRYNYQKSKKLKSVDQIYTEKDNIGTRILTADRNQAAYNTWVASGSKLIGSIYYAFKTKEEAYNAMLEIPCIKLASDTGELISTEILEFGVFWDSYNNEYWEAFLQGSSLSFSTFQAAEKSFIKHNGRKIVSVEPKKVGSKKTAGSTKLNVDLNAGVQFVCNKNVVIMGITGTKEIYKAPNKSIAIEFLKSKKIIKQYYYIEIETPNGWVGKDIDGVYES